MPRKGRPWFPGAKYHIISRGVRRLDLFYEDKDRTKYLSLLEEAISRYDFNLYTYCLMTNHIHMQIETKETPPSPIMQYINTKYAKYFNEKYDFSGHVFEKRYIAELVDSRDYELDLSKYIHLNPLKANMVNKLEDFPWSSYRVYALLENSSIIYKDQILSYFPEPKSHNYNEFLKTGYIHTAFIKPE